MQCQYCGRSVNGDSLFCPSCGKRIEKESIISEKTEKKKKIRTKPKEQKKAKKGKVILISGVTVIALCASLWVILFLIHKFNTRQIGISGLSNIEIGQRYNEAVSFFENGDYEKAIDLLNTVPEEYIWYSKIQSTKQEIVETYINIICNRINSCLEEGKYDEALLIIEDVANTIISFDIYNQKYYNDIITQYCDSVFPEVDSFVNSERFADALECLEYVSLVVKDTSFYNKKKENVLSSFKQNCLSKAEVFLKQGKYDEAISALQSFADIITNDKEVTGKINEITNTRKNIEKEQILNEIEKYETDGNYEGGIKYINNKIGSYRNDGDISKKLNNLKDKYRSKILADAEEAFNLSGYLSAIDVLSSSKEILPNDVTITQKINDYKTYAPVSIKNFKVTASSGYGFQDSASDPRGEIAVDAIKLSSYVEFYLAGDYSKFTAKLDPVAYFSTNEYQGVQLRILADDIEAYKSPTITYKTDNLDVSVNIKNADYLTFELIYVGGSKFSDYWSADPILIYDAFVTKQ